MPNKKAVIETKKGTIEVELFADEVPGTVANFEKLANSLFYDGTKFHRVIPNFMVQGGDPYSKTGKGPVGTGGPGYTIKCETQKNTHKHVAGTLSMAHAGKDTGGSQFFICHGNSSNLDHHSRRTLATSSRSSAIVSSTPSAPSRPTTRTHSARPPGRSR